MINNPQELNQFVLKYGKYPSGLITLLPHFKNFWSGDALIRFVENDHLLWGAHGPLNGDTQTVSDFFYFAQKENKLAILSPTDEVLANELKQKKFYLTPIGVTPHFDLKDYFEKFDPVNLLPLARSLKRKGAKVQCIKGDACTPELKEIFTRLIKDWEESKTLSFLCRTKPLENFENKFFLYLMDKEEVTALVTALPYDKNKIYLCDYIRQPHSRAGSIEYTLIEGMRELHSLGFVEASLGLCPLADIKRPWFAKIIFEYNLFYNFQGLQSHRSVRPFAHFGHA